MFASLGLVCIGNGFFKPNISTLLGLVYNRDDLKPRKDSAYNIFYMGINIGALICNFVAAWLRNNYSWGWAFRAAGIGMALGVVIFIFGMGAVSHADVKKPMRPDDLPLWRIVVSVFLPAIGAGLLGWFVPHAFGFSILGEQGDDAFLFACIPITLFYFSMWWRAKGFERRRISTLLILFGTSILFWNIYNQNITALTFWANTYTNREVPASAEPILEKLHAAQTVDTTPLRVPVLDEHFRTTVGPDGEVVTKQGLNPYFQNLPRARWPQTGKRLNLVSTEIFQSVNPFWIIALTPLVVSFFGFMRRRGREPSTPAKIAWGVVISGLSSVVMMVAAWSTDIYHDKVSMAWLVTSYGVFTVSELFVSPIGLSLVSKVAPRRVAGLMMGGWFLTVSMGGMIAGVMASKWDWFDSKSAFFAVGAVPAIAVGLLLLPLSKRLARVIDEANASDD
jgi:POT family proton-dependent oligopeptide transporter